MMLSSDVSSAYFEGAAAAYQTTTAGLTPLSRPDWLPEAQWPFPTYRMRVEGSTIAVTDVGSGPVLLFVHTGFWSFLWRDVMLRLASDFRCICLDAPGVGRSDRLPKDLISLDRSAAAVAQVIEQRDLANVTLVVHDLGGPAGIAGAAQFPERVRAIAALNTFGWWPSGAVFRGMLALMSSTFIREFDVLTEFLPRVTSNAFGAGRNLDEASRKALRAGIGREGLRAFHLYMRDARHCDSLYSRVQAALTNEFRTLPFLTIFGDRNDPFKFQLRWKALFPHARQVVVAKGNHFPMCDDPNLVATTIRSWHRECVMPGH